MFEFLFKQQASQASVAGQPSSGGSHAPLGTPAERRSAQAELARNLAGDESAAVELILNSEFADVRLAAAEHVVSQPALEKVQQAMRNSDRRVAKLVQGRLDAIRHVQAEQKQAQACIALAQRLFADEKLTPNLVADLDRQWKVVDAAPSAAAEFAHVRNALAERLEAQVSLQRAMIDALAALRRHPGAEELERLASEHEAHLASPERASLPRHLLNDFDAALAAERAAQRPAANAGAVAPAAMPAPAAPVAAETERPAGNARAGAMEHAAPGPVAITPAPFHGAAVTHADGQDAAALRPPRPPKEKHKPSPAEQEANRHFMDLVEAMEAALAQGQLHIAAEHDKALKDSKTGRLSPAQAERLAHARADLKRLGDWARWGGNVSREELVHAVESLPAEGLGMSELAKKVGSMRERWKGLDGVSGAAPKSLWEKFDAACTAAYAPAAAHFKHLADERHANAAKAQQLVDEAYALIARDMAQLEAAGGAQVDREESASGNLPHTHDWRTLASSTQRLRQAWSRLGTIDRKDKKRLDAAFSKAMDALMAPLDSQRKIEVARREQLIEEVGKLNPLDRHTIDTLRRLQESWQGHARALPLERKTEQALWQKFRAACDQIFARRKEHAHAADHERKAHLHAREAICAGLEGASFEGDDKSVLAAIGKALKDAAAAWHASGVVPRASEQKIDQRYRAAVGALQSQADAIRKRAGAAQANALREKLRLVQALENALVEAGDIDSADWDKRWQALAALPAEQERTLRIRFDAALKAAGEGASARAAYAGQLETNRQRLLSEVLRLEIVAGIDSGAEFAKDRLKMQVEVLQSSLKSGQKPASHAAQFLALCAMPALVDARTASRIEQLFRKTGAEGK
ncbi:DUF349 domain-containing protein [Duganella sp. Root1480D1]|uniref:DUF349 domain-containing protein n=1 Tax=Duganella sp. Root1480D1 TaxID=1736471 RepID=UPI00070AE0B0|nr:DUF349 domain-containing protein [Duganella sp. Root1480D1]KQZ44816.1 hypothetical protein ASD58_00715 [Duganella sp. Root1480D1]